MTVSQTTADTYRPYASEKDRATTLQGPGHNPRWLDERSFRSTTDPMFGVPETYVTVGLSDPKTKFLQVSLISSVFEASKKESDDALKTFLRKGLENTSVTCVLAGASTSQRRWVRYEIARSIIKGNGLLTVFIHGVENQKNQTSQNGSDPLSQLGLYRSNDQIFLAEARGGKWVQYADYTRAIPGSRAMVPCTYP